MGKYFYDSHSSDFIPVEHFPDLVYRLFTEKENVSTTRPWAGLFTSLEYLQTRLLRHR
jgi:hypothetical protein